MEITNWELAKFIVPAVVVPSIVFYGWVKFHLGKIDGTIDGMRDQMNDIKDNMKTQISDIKNNNEKIEKRMEDYLKYLIEGVKTIYTKDTPQSFKDKVEEMKMLIGLVIPRRNPISQEDIDKFNKIKDKIINAEQLTEQELDEFGRLGEKIQEELPSQGEKERFGSLISKFSGYASGLILGNLFKIND